MREAEQRAAEKAAAQERAAAERAAAEEERAAQAEEQRAAAAAAKQAAVKQKSSGGGIKGVVQPLLIGAGALGAGFVFLTGKDSAEEEPLPPPSAAPSLRPSSKDRASNEASRSPNAPPMRVSRSVVIAVPVPAMGTSEVSNTSAGGVLGPHGSGRCVARG